jgi:coenzyme PQQ precursor peptide PqqA
MFISTNARQVLNLLTRRTTMKWTTPSATDMRFGFEVTMYVMNR